MASLEELARILEQIRDRLGSRNLETEMAKMDTITPPKQNRSPIGETVKVVMGDIPGITQLVNEFQKINRLFSTLFPGGGTKILDLFKGIGTIPKALNAMTGTPANVVGNAVVNLATNKSSDVIRGGVQAVTEATILSKILNKDKTSSKNNIFTELESRLRGLSNVSFGKGDTSLKFDPDKIFYSLTNNLKEFGKVGISTSKILENFWTGFRHPIDSIKNIMSGPIGLDLFKFGRKLYTENVLERVNRAKNVLDGKAPEGIFSRIGQLGGNIKGLAGQFIALQLADTFKSNPIMAEALTSTKGAMGETIMKWTGGTASTVAASKVAGVVGAKVAGAGAGGTGGGAVATGAAGGAGAAGAGGVAMGVGVILGGIALVGAALIGLAAATIGVSKMMIESQRHLADVNAQMAVGFAMHDLRTFFKDMASAQRRAPSTVKLMEAYDSLMAKLQPAFDKLFILFAQFLTKLLNIIEFFAPLINKIAEIPQKFIDTLPSFPTPESDKAAGLNSLGWSNNKTWYGWDKAPSDKPKVDYGGGSDVVMRLVGGIWKYITKAEEVADKQGAVADQQLATVEHLSPEILINQLAYGNYEGVKDRAFEQLKPSWLGP